MTRSLGRALSHDLVDRFSQRDIARRLGAALPFVTVDADGRPHPMLLSYLEIRAYDTRTVGLVPAPDYCGASLGGVSLGGSAGRGPRRGASPGGASRS